MFVSSPQERLQYSPLCTHTMALCRSSMTATLSANFDLKRSRTSPENPEVSFPFDRLSVALLEVQRHRRALSKQDQLSKMMDEGRHLFVFLASLLLHLRRGVCHLLSLRISARLVWFVAVFNSWLAGVSQTELSARNRSEDR